MTMALSGTGALAIWNGIADGADAEFVEWHVREHMPERVSIPGFISGRRYTAIDGHPKYFNFYEVESPAVLRSAAYLSRLNRPSPWTTRVVSTFTDTSRTLCRVAASAGIGSGTFVVVARFAAPVEPNAACAFVRALPGNAGICAAHLFLREEGPAQVTSETRLRSAPDVTWPAVLIVETATAEAAATLRTSVLSDAALSGAGFEAIVERGLYRLDYEVRHEDAATQAVPQILHKEA